MLQNGIQIKELSIFDVKIEQLYIKWDERIDISLKEITLLSSTSQASSQLDYKSINKYLQAIQYTTNWFNSIDIEKIKVNDTIASFKYKKNAKGAIVVKSPTLTLSSSLFYNHNILDITIQNFHNKKKDVLVKGNIYLDLNQLKAFTNLNLNINKDANLTLYSSIDTGSMDYLVQSNNHINDVKHIVKLASLPKEIKFWTYDAIELKNLEIQNIKGSIDFNNIDQAYKNLYVHAIAHNLDYTYNTKLDAVHTKTTDLEFKNGVLYIRPQNAYSYGTSLGQSWLKIDFSKKEELLTLHLLFDGKLNKDMLKILSTYKINLPFLQHQGLVSTDLIIAVNLMSIDVDAKGSFSTKKANFDYLGLNIDIFDTKILLNNYDVTINKMKAQYKDIARADVKVAFNAKTSKGKIDFEFDKIAFKELTLNTDPSKLKASYLISPNKDTININKSSWKVDKYNLLVDALTLPFNLKTLQLKVPTTYLELQDISSALLEGTINLKNYKTDLSLDVLNLTYNGIHFSQSNTPFSIKYSDKLSIVSKENVFFDISGTQYVLNKPNVTISEKDISLKNSKITIGRYITTKLYAKYDRTNAKAHVSLSDFKVSNYKQDKILYSNKKILLSIKDNNKSFKISSKELGATFALVDDGWKVYVNSISQIADNSELLQEFHLEKGNITLFKNKDDEYIHFKSSLSYPYQILTKDGVPTKEYEVEGKLKNDKVFFTLNKNTSVSITKEIRIKSKDSGININEILRLLKDTQSSGNKEERRIKLKAINSYIYLSNSRKIISDLINLQYINSILTAQLTHAGANAGLRYEGEKFHFYGKNFNDKFMENLFSLSKFKGGTLDFSIDGKIDDYSGLMYIKNSTIMDYKILNNILAFINTVPSLITFSLPGYSTNGLFVEQAYVNFNSNNNLFNFSDIYLKSKELNILGKGNANFKKDTIDINLNLKTDLGSNASKIPLVGYILFDEESMSTTLKIEGKLSNPKIKSLLARDIAIAPLNIIKRMFTLPYNLLTNLKQDSNSSK